MMMNKGKGKGYGKKVANPSLEYNFHGREIAVESIAQIEQTLMAASIFFEKKLNSH